MDKTLPLRCCLLVLLFIATVVGNAYAQVAVDSTGRDSLKLKYPLKDLPFLNLYQKKNALDIGLPSNISREVIFDPLTRQYIVREKLGSRLYRPPQYLTIDEYQEYEGNLLKRNYWRELSDQQLTDYRQDRLIPTIYVQSEAFEKIFGGNTIDIIPRGSADISIMAQHNKNANPMFNERQRRQWGFDFDQRIQMNLTGQIGDRLKLTTNYNTEAQFDFENQIRLDYTGKDDDIIKRIELGNVSMPLNTTLISGTQALFGLKTQLQFGKLNVTGIFSQQRSQQREITIKNGAQESEFALKADEYEDNQHYFL
ncbi:cell surface protein SprA, partial [Parapedobacter pyrenivorans]|uniref:T9SS outer membrane translocon Sov/SprA n=1 Tax=Parapedobacter pyrenivorans TaxID=1305674 RepID=UPI0033429D52